MCRPLLLLAARFLGHLGCLLDLHRNKMPRVTPCYDPLHYLHKLYVQHYEFWLRFFLAKFQFECMIARHCARLDFSQYLLPFQGSVLQNRDHVACQYAHSVLYCSLAHNCRENQNDCIILLAVQAVCRTFEMTK